MVESVNKVRHPPEQDIWSLCAVDLGCGQVREVITVNKPIVMTTHQIDKVPDFLTRKVDHVVQIEDYTEQQLELIVLQRLKYCQLEYSDEKVLKLIVEKGNGDLHKMHMMIRLLKDAITVMQADGRVVLTVDDVEQGRWWVGRNGSSHNCPLLQ